MKTMEVQIKGDQWNKRFTTVQVYCLEQAKQKQKECIRKELTIKGL